LSLRRVEVCASAGAERVGRCQQGAPGPERQSDRTKAIAIGALYHILQNRLYRGEIVHKGKPYPGQHDAIIDEELWSDVQAILSDNRVERTTRSAKAAPKSSQC